jgi:CheY-like chemotaxis protein
VPVTLDVNKLVRGFEPLLKQAVGEAVTLEVDLADAELCTHVDPTQLETALLNLAVNARDAMPDGGVLRISTGRARTSDSGAEWVSVEICDSGVGMEPAVLERVFEPFFTTKEVGKGSGLGLSQVYGFVRQSEGEVRLESTPGQGTTFRLLLPPSSAPAQELRAETGPAAMEGGDEHLLVVEDDAQVLALTVDMLTGLGYAVTHASNAVDALEVLKSDVRIDLLFSDVVMPGGVSGVSLAREAREVRPELKVLLTSGFVGDGAALAAREFPLLDKPYEAADLARRLRELLTAEAPRAKRVRSRKADPAVAAAG